jgi:hypothetical protein
MTRLVLAAFAVLTLNIVAGGGASAQSPFPPVRPGQTTAILGTPPLPPPSVVDECPNNFAPLIADAENKADLVKTASRRHALPAQACKLIGDYHAAEAKLIEYVETNAARCGIPAQIAIQLRANQKHTEDIRIKVCTIAGQGKRASVVPIGDFVPREDASWKRVPAGPTGDFYPRGAIDRPH